MRGYVYAIRSLSDPTLVYYGSTKENLARRMAQHRKNHRGYLAGKYCFTTSFRVLEAGGAYIELVEIVEYEEKAQLRAAEGKCIRGNQCVNKYVAGRSNEQYRGDNAVKISARKKQHYADNATTINAQKAAYDAAHAEHRKAKHSCGCGGKFTIVSKARHLRTLKHCAWVEKTA